MSKFSKGSEWRKWDLHIHSTASDGKSTPKEIIDEAKSKGLSVIALTDHHTVENLEETKKLGQAEGITVISGVEFKTEYGSKSVHLIGLFPDRFGENELTEEAISSYVLAKLNISRSEIIAKGRQENHALDDVAAFRKGMLNVFVDFKKACNLIHEVGGIVVVHNGSKNNGLDAEVKHLGKSDHNAHSLYEDLGVLKDELLTKYVDVCEIRSAEDDADFYLSRFGRPSIIASDAHDTASIGSKFVWIKADPTFEGLKQIIFEPAERVRIQEQSPAFDYEKSTFTAIKFAKMLCPFAGDNDVRFERMELPLNDGLVSIIGGRGSGKSALIDYISNGLRTDKDLKFDYSSTGVVVARKVAIDEAPQDIHLPISDSQNVPFVYISQSQIKNLVADQDSFTHDLRKTIGVMDAYGVPIELRNEIDGRINEFYALAKTINPNKDSDERSEKVRLDQEIGKCQDFIARVTSDKNKAKLEKYANLVARKKNLGIIIDQITRFRQSLQEVADLRNTEIKTYNETLNRLDVKIPLIDVTPTLNYLDQVLLPLLNKRSDEQGAEIASIRDEFRDYSGDVGTLLGKVAEYREKQELFVAQLNKLRQAEDTFARFKQDGFSALGVQIQKSVESYKEMLEAKWATFKNGAEELSDERKVLLDKILNERNLELAIKIVFDTDKMCELLLEGLDRRKFNADKILSHLKSVIDINGFWDFIAQRNGSKGVFDESIPLPLRSRIIDVFFRHYAEFIRHEVMIMSDGKPITKLSHGQQGTIYLRLQIAANLFSETLIYDQPEDDLDNQFITSELVDIFREIKKYRQVIIVSHNANLVVNADSEQVIVADNRDGILSYEAGSLENPVIREKVCGILEGGRAAFAKRGKKYWASRGIDSCLV